MNPLRVMCPHCKSPSKARSGHQKSPIYREQTFVCTNVECGHVFVAGISVVRTLSPSAMPNPDIRLPYSRRIDRRVLIASLQET